ncbi:LacI family DNA-binding transcriptional regulator [Mycobacterium sp. BMJ-28]
MSDVHGLATKRRPTAADVGREAGVSRATVGFVLNDTPGQSISPATRDKVLDAAHRLGYRPHAGAQALARGSTRIVLLVLPDWPVGHSIQRFIEAADGVLDAAGYTLVTYTPRGEGSSRPLWELLEPAVVIGFEPFSPEQLASMRAQRISHIVPDGGHDVLAPEIGPGLQLDHLYELGHRRIGYASTADPRLSEIAGRRAEAALQHAQTLGLDPPIIRVVASQDDATSAVRDWLEEGVTAVAAYNDEVAALVAGAALHTGVAVPEQLSVVGHDDSPIATLFVPSLSSVRRDEEADGRMFASIAVALAEGRGIADTGQMAREIVVARSSTAPRRS